MIPKEPRRSSVGQRLFGNLSALDLRSRPSPADAVTQAGFAAPQSRREVVFVLCLINLIVLASHNLSFKLFKPNEISDERHGQFNTVVF